MPSWLILPVLCYFSGGIAVSALSLILNMGELIGFCDRRNCWRFVLTACGLTTVLFVLIAVGWPLWLYLQWRARYGTAWSPGSSQIVVSTHPLSDPEDRP